MSVVSFEEMEIKRQEMIASFKDVATAMTRCVALIEDFARVSPNALPHAAALSTIESGALIAEGLAAVVAGNAVGGVAGKKQRLRKEKKPKDPKAPKRPPSAYLLFQNDVRDKVREKNPGMSYREILGLIAQQWKALSEVEKKVYEDTYEKATIDFRVRDQAYRNDGTIMPPAEGLRGEDDEEEDETSSSSEEEPPVVAITPSKKDKKRKSEVVDKKTKKSKKKE